MVRAIPLSVPPHSQQGSGDRALVKMKQHVKFSADSFRASALKCHLLLSTTWQGHSLLKDTNLDCNIFNQANDGAEGVFVEVLPSEEEEKGKTDPA